MPSYDPAADCIEVLPERPLPRPTLAPPGSAEKVQVMALRFALGLSVFHPDDAPLPLRLGYAPREGQRDPGRGVLLQQLPEGVLVEVPNQTPVPPYQPYTDGPGYAARRERQRKRTQSPEGRERDRLRKRRDRAKKRTERERLLCGGRERQQA